MIKILHFADLHLGVENYGRLDPQTGLSTRLADFLRCFDFLVDHAAHHDVDLALFAGDAFKTRDPSPTYQREFARRIRRLAHDLHGHRMTQPESRENLLASHEGRFFERFPPPLRFQSGRRPGEWLRGCSSGFRS